MNTVYLFQQSNNSTLVVGRAVDTTHGFQRF